MDGNVHSFDPRANNFRRIRKSLTCNIDCDADPFIPDGWSIEEHRKGGRLILNPSSTCLYWVEEQERGNHVLGHTLPQKFKSDGYIEGFKLREKLDCLPVLNATALDFLLKHLDSVPEHWEGNAPNIRYIAFWGTIYSQWYNGKRVLCVRTLYYDWQRKEHETPWKEGHFWLNGLWGCDRPAVMLAA